MNWNTEVPKESGWYWAKVNNFPEVVYLAEDIETVWVTCEEDPRKTSHFIWGDKLEIPE